jgi:hypothetical protein
MLSPSIDQLICQSTTTTSLGFEWKSSASLDDEHLWGVLCIWLNWEDPGTLPIYANAKIFQQNTLIITCARENLCL